VNRLSDARCWNTLSPLARGELSDRYLSDSSRTTATSRCLSAAHVDLSLTAINCHLTVLEEAGVQQRQTRPRQPPRLRPAASHQG
jgi:hypothetical protein